MGRGRLEAFSATTPVSGGVLWANLHLLFWLSLVATAVGTDVMGMLSPILYLIAIPMAFVSPWLSGALYVAVALMWLVPDRRIERVMAARQ